MRRVGYLLMILLLAACGTANVAVPTAEPADEAPEPTGAADANPEQESRPAYGDSIAPAQTPVEAGVIRERDWTKGAEDPLVTIIEYGDFQ